MNLYIRKSDSQTGEERDGSYVARARIGTEKDGSPMYRYFKTVAEYKTYLSNKAGGKQDQDKKSDSKLDTELKEKTDRERAESKRKQQKFAKEKERDLFVKKDNKKDKKKGVKKSLFITGVK